VTTILSYLSAAVVLMVAIVRMDGKTDAAPDIREIHPAVFELVTCWDSDTEQPVVTEINLDAVRKNRNQFNATTVRLNGEWVQCASNDGHGFRRFRIISSDKGANVVEFQNNAGGTLTTKVLIEFVIENREIRSAGAASLVSVLRVMSVDTM